MGYPRTRAIAPTRPQGLKKTNELSVIILCAAPGYRMRGHGNKTLLKDKYGITLLENQTQILRQNYAECEITVVGGFEIDKLYKNKPPGIHLVESAKFEETNEVEEARIGLMNATFDNILILFGDLYFFPPFIDQLTLDKSFMVLDKEERMMAEDAGATVIDGHLTILNLALMKPKWTKTAFLKDKELRLFKQFCFDKQNSKLYLFEAFNYILERGGELEARFSNFSGNIVHVDSSKELEKI